MKWKRIIGWAGAGNAALIFLAAVAGYLYLRSTGFQRFAIGKIEQQAAATTGATTKIGGIDFNLSTLTAHLYDITLRGSESPNQPPLLHADKLTVSVKVISALHREVSLNELLIEHPIVHVQVDRSGKNNLPSPPPSQNA